ncbi:ABC transporter permease [Chitinilyticum piscinae]|uniref:ABC transporter permease n=1 Tax=Chitinilyticum piscinae TaxID=2866724 RepID=A0A8J7G1Q6_9NEIS|nr:ABC transporter permease [Chitinilyticum piscinae]MBE9609773.1 ABC transporter permease [Chitinilyticum piscinae]
MLRGVPLSYIGRNLLTRRLTTALTAGGMALVVFVFATVLMLEAGLRQTLVDTGSASNVIAIRAGSQTEIQSGLPLAELDTLATLPHIARDSQGRPLLVRETLVLNSLVKKSSGQPSNVTLRGTSHTGLALRPQVRISSGRAFLPGSNEIMVGRSIAEQFAGVAVGSSLRFARRDWLVVGIFDAGKTGFNSEIWGDSEQMQQAFRRSGAYSSAIFRLEQASDFPKVASAAAAERRLTVDVQPENAFYAGQSKVMATFIGILGLTLTLIFSIGAIIGAMITMYSSVASRVNEIGALRAMGFRRSRILTAFLLESLLLSLLGGMTGLLLASGMQFFTISTMNWQTFSELAFSFALTPAIMLQSLLFALTMGFLGGFLPALRASRMKIVDALRTA